MSRIQSRDTRPEIEVRSFLHRCGLRFRKNTGDRIFGKPDIVLPAHGAVVFVHGCFWHRHADCPYAYFPKSREEFWQRKFDATVARDIAVKTRLRKDGWRVYVIWECEISNMRKMLSIIKQVKSPHNNF